MPIQTEQQFDATFEAAVIQYYRPGGWPEQTGTRLPREAEPGYRDMVACGCRFEAEVLTTGEVSVTIFNIKDEIDVDVSLTGNGPAIQAGMVDMIKRQLWKEEVHNGGP